MLFVSIVLYVSKLYYRSLLICTNNEIRNNYCEFSYKNNAFGRVYNLVKTCFTTISCFRLKIPYGASRHIYKHGSGGQSRIFDTTVEVNHFFK